MEDRTMGRFVIILGLVLLVLGLFWPMFSRLGLGRLPGDIVVERENFTLYIPIVTSLVLSIGLSLLLWLVNR
jgi:hypothetical protein